MQDILTKAIEEANKKIEEAKKTLAIIESLPTEVQQMQFFVCSPERNPFLSFKGGSFEELRALKKFFPAVPLVWCDNTYGTEQEMRAKCNREYLVNGQTIKGFEYYESKGRAFPLASPYLAKFEKLQYPTNGKVTIVWDAGNFRIWYEMNATDYRNVTHLTNATDVHLWEEMQRLESRRNKPVCSTPYLKAGQRIDYWGNNSTCYCKQPQDVEAYERAIFFGE